MNAAEQQMSDVPRAVSRVPEPTVGFWVVTVLIAGMGETASDFLFTHLAPPLVLVIGLVGLVAALVVQFRARRYVPWIYWVALAVVSVVGTMPADVARVGLGVAPLVVTGVFLVVLVVILAGWYRRGGTLSIRGIHARRPEAFYWAAVFTMFALGTAAGDLTANTLHLGYLVSAIAFGVVMALVMVGRAWFGLNGIAAFWLAYVFARPLGASIADWLAQPSDAGGLGWGTGPVTVALAIVVIGLVGYLARSGANRTG